MCHAENPEAVKIFVESLRYPFAEKHAGLDTGIRGNGSQNFASQIWGLQPNEYMLKADMWPPEQETAKCCSASRSRHRWRPRTSRRPRQIPGIGFAEWGPGDQSFFLVGPPIGNSRGDRENHPAMQGMRARIFKAVKEANLFFLNSCNENNVIDMLKEGVMICTGGETPAADKGREFTKRPGVW